MSYSDLPQFSGSKEFANLLSVLAHSNPEPEALAASLKNALVDDTSREVFVSFAEQHPALISASPLLKNAYTAVISGGGIVPDSLPFASTLSKTSDVATVFFPTQLEVLEANLLADGNKFLKQLESGNDRYRALTAGEWKLVCAHIEAGIIDLKEMAKNDPDLLLDFLSMQNERGEVLLHHPAIFQHSIPLFKELAASDDELLFQILSIPNNQRETALEQEELFKIALPWLKELATADQDLLIDLLFSNILSEDGLFNNPEIFDTVIPWLNTLLQTDKNLLLSILSGKNPEGNPPLFFADNYNKFLLSLEFFRSTDKALLLSILSIQNERGKTVLDDIHRFESSLDWFGELALNDRETLVNIFSICDADGLLYLHDMELFLIALPLLNQLAKRDKALLLEILSVNDRHLGFPLFYNKYAFEFGLRWFEDLAKHEGTLLRDILSIRNVDNRTVLEYNETFLPFLPLMRKLAVINKLLLIDILSIKDATGQFAIGVNNLDLKWIQELAVRDKDLLVKILSIPYTSVLKMIHDVEIFKSILPLMQELATADKDLLIRILSIETSSGITSLEYYDSFEASLPLLKHLAANDKELLVRILTIRNTVDGSTPLHTPDNWEMIAGELENNGIVLALIKNTFGLVPGEKVALSNAWMDRPKIDSQLMVRLSPEEYSQRATVLRRDVLAAWDSLKFGYEKDELKPEINDLNPLLLDVSGRFKLITDEGTPLSQPQIDELAVTMRNALNIMLDKIVNLTPFLATPREDQPVERLNYYTPMLIKFENVLRAIQQRDSLSVAGSLISIATTQIDDRCGLAFHLEIGQQDDYYRFSEGGLTFDELIKRSVVLTFQSFIENIVRRKYHSDVHYLNQFFYATGLSPVSDPIVQMEKERVREIIEDEFEYNAFVPKFNEALPSAYVNMYLKSLTPKDFDEGYLPIIAQAKKLEEAMLHNVRSILSGNFSGAMVEEAFKLVQAYRGPSLAAVLDSPLFNGPKSLVAATNERFLAAFNEALRKQHLDEVKLSILPEAPGKQDIAQLREQLRLHLAAQLSLPTEASNQQKMAIANARRIINNEVIKYVASVKSAAKLRNEMLNKNVSTDEECRAILMALDLYRKGTTGIAERIEEQAEGTLVDASFNPREGRLPSQVYEDKRHIAYNEDWIGSELSSAFKVLEVMGVLEKTRYP